MNSQGRFDLLVGVRHCSAKPSDYPFCAMHPTALHSTVQIIFVDT